MNKSHIESAKKSAFLRFHPQIIYQVSKLKFPHLNYLIFNIFQCGLVGSARIWYGKGCEFDSWQCWIYILCSLGPRLLGSLRGSLGTYGLTQNFV